MADYPRYLVVPDTNVCVSGGILSASPPAQIIQAWRIGDIDFAVSDPLLKEIYEVLQRPYFTARVGWSREQVGEYINALRDGSLVVPATEPASISPDPDDNILFSCAIEAGADYIVSGDIAHVLCIDEYRGVKTISPRDFMTLLEQQERAA